MDFPRLIYLDDDTKMRLVSYLENELINHYAERGSWVEDLVSTQTDYFAEPTTEVKTFPFRGAANIVIPLIATVVEALHSKTMTTLFALDDFAVIKTPDQFTDQSWGLTKYCNYELLENGADMYRFCDNSHLENLKFGSCVGKAGYEKVVKTAIRDDGETEREFEVVTKQGATADNVPLANFLMPFSCQDPQTAPWCGEEHNKPSFEVLDLCDNGFFYPEARDILDHWVLQTTNGEQSSSSYLQAQEHLENKTPLYPKRIAFVELWLSWNVDDNKKGKRKEIVVYYHRLSRNILGVRYNWHDDLRRPYRTGKYFTIENRWAGIGVGKQVQSFQREITIQHRQRLDNATIANIRMFKINKLSGYGPGEPIFPGKMWFVDSMDDIEPLEAGEVYPSSFNDEIQTLSYVQQRSGVNEMNLGMPQVGTPGTASSDMARLQEGNKKNDYTFKNYKRFLTEISRDVISNVFQFGTRDIQIFQYIPNGDQVKQFVMTSPLSLIREQLIMNLNLVGQNENQLQDRASWTQLSGQLTQYYTALMQFAMETKNNQLMQLLSQYIPMGATEAMKQIAETFDVRNIERLIPIQLTMQPIQNPNLLPSMNPQDGSQGNTGAGGDTGASGAIQASPMGNPSPSYS